MLKENQQENRPYAIVIGLDTMQGLQTARILANHNIPVIAFVRDPKHHACRSRVCDKILEVDTTSHELITTLQELGPTLTGKAVVYPCHDQCVALISKNRDQLADWYHIVMAEAGVMETMMSKQQFYELAEANGVRYPQTLLLQSRADAEAAASNLCFPCVLKPVRRSSRWDEMTMAKAFRVESADEFLSLYDRVHGWAPALIAQQWIEGTDADLYSCNCYFTRESGLVASFVAKKLRQWPPRTGSSCLGEECRNDTVLTDVVRIFESVDYVGLGYIEMKRDARTGVHYAIEANVGRPTGRSAIAEAGGVDLLYTMYCDALGLPLPSNREQQYLGVKWIDLRHDIQSALHYFRRGELTIAEWYRSVRGRKAFAVFSWSDPVPFLVDIWRAFSVLLSRGERAKRRHPSNDSSEESIPVTMKASKEAKS